MFNDQSAQKYIQEFPHQQILSVLPGDIKEMLARLPGDLANKLEEIRIRQGQPLMLGISNGDRFIAYNGQPVNDPDKAYHISRDDILRVTRMVSNSSLYALEEELKNGFITLPGGYRVGITGRVVLEDGKIKTMKNISGFNIRICREFKGISKDLLSCVLDEDKRVKHTLILSPPRCGKTTLLRDLIRLLSNGLPGTGFNGVTVGLVDERSELAGCYRGVPQRDVGIRTDVLDGCPKSQGMIMLLRAMAPQVLATDEIGKQEDINSMEELINAGVSVISTVHGSSLDEISKRPALKYLLELQVVERFIILGRSRGPGTVEDIICGSSGKSLGVKKWLNWPAR